MLANMSIKFSGSPQELFEALRKAGFEVALPHGTQFPEAEPSLPNLVRVELPDPPEGFRLFTIEWWDEETRTFYEFYAIPQSAKFQKDRPVITVYNDVSPKLNFPKTTLVWSGSELAWTPLCS